MQSKRMALPLFFLLLGLASSAVAETCPDADAIAPCTCEEDEDYDGIEIVCSEDDLTVDKLRESMKALAGKKYVDLFLGDFPLGKLPSDIFEGIGVTKLEISHCDLDSLTDGSGPALKGLEDTLEELDILGGFTEDNVPASLNLGHLRQLKSLSLSFNAITEIGNDWFEQGPTSLQYLMISNCGVEKLGDRAFEKLSNLKELSFDGNRVGPLKRSMFPSSANELEELELDNNALRSLPDDIFINMPSLEKISLRNNGLLRLEELTWRTVWNSDVVLYLEGNPIQCDSHMNWIVNQPKMPFIFGKCDSPREVSEEDIRDFIRNKRKQ